MMRRTAKSSDATVYASAFVVICTCMGYVSACDGVYANVIYSHISKFPTHHTWLVVRAFPACVLLLARLSVTLPGVSHPAELTAPSS